MPNLISNILKDCKNINPEKSLRLIMLNSAYLQIDATNNISDNENLLLVLIEDKKDSKKKRNVDKIQNYQTQVIMTSSSL